MRHDPSPECGRVLPVLLLPRESVEATRLPLELFVHERVLPFGARLTTFASGMSFCRSSAESRTPLLALISSSDSASACARVVTPIAASENAIKCENIVSSRRIDARRDNTLALAREHHTIADSQ